MKSDKMGSFRRIATIDQGSYGDIYLCTRQTQEPRHKQQKYYAVKRFRSFQQNCGVHFTTLGQIRLLSCLDHPNVIKCLQVTNRGLDVCMAMEFMVRLQNIMTYPRFREPQKRIVMLQLLQGLAYLHSEWVMHRDLKPQNVLISKQGVIKIVDFGFARRVSSPRRQLTFKVCTRQFRAPEIDLGSSYYTDKSDIWSIGCIMAYIYLGRSLFQVTEGQNDLDFLSQIFQLRGTPNEENWPGCYQLPQFKEYTKSKAKPLSSVIAGLSKPAQILLQSMLQLDPRKRPSAQQCLQFDYFRQEGEDCLAELCREQYKKSLAGFDMQL